MTYIITPLIVDIMVSPSATMPIIVPPSIIYFQHITLQN